MVDYYNEYVVTNKEKEIYLKENDSFVVVGRINSNVQLSLDGIVDNYFKLKGFDEDYYIKYNDLDAIDSISVNDDRFNKYIPFEEKIITSNVTKFYYEEELIYTFNKSFEFSVIVKDEDRYGVIYNDMLLYINSGDVSEVVKDNTIAEENISGIGVLNYHFFYDDSVSGESAKCNQSICASKSQFKEHLDYIKNNNFFTPTMKELEMYIDGKIQLPKSVVITIDDGWRVDLGIKMLTEYKLNATVFVVTSWYDPNKYKTNYVEVHSHSHNLHNTGDCSNGQGGGIQCLDEDVILNDLKTSSDKIGGSTVFCYPFYEYNDYSISMLKKAGYTMAFAGESSYSDNLVKVGSDKYRLPRFVVVNYTSMNDLINYLN